MEKSIGGRETLKGGWRLKEGQEFERRVVGFKREVGGQKEDGRSKGGWKIKGRVGGLRKG